MLNWRKNWFYFLPPLLLSCAVMTVTIKADLAAFMVAGENAEQVLLASEMQSGALSRRYLISIGVDDKSKVPKAFVLQVQNQLKTIDGVVDVWSPGQQANISQAMHSLYAQHGGALYSLNPKQDLAQIFTVEGLGQRAQLLKKLLLSPQGLMFKKIALQDPLLLTLNGFQSVSGQMQTAVNEDSNYRMLILETAMAGLNAPEQSRIQTEIKALFKQLNQAQTRNYQLEMTGVPIFAAATQSLIQGDITKVSILSSVALMILFMLIFRSFSTLFQVFSLLIIVIVSSILSTQLIFGYVHGMTIAIGATLVGICIDYPIHAVAHAQSVVAGQRKTVIARIWPSMLLGGLTTMIGYIALGISGYPGFQQVAVFAATGIIVSLFITRFIFPDLISSEQKPPLNVPLVSAWAKFCQRFRPWLISLLLIMLALSFMGLKSLHWMKDMQELTPELNYLKINDQRIRARMTSIEPGRFVLVTGENIEQVLQKTEAVYPVLDQLKQTGTLTDYFGLYPWLLSAQRQQQNFVLLQDYLTLENQQLWRQALKQQGLSVKRLGQLNYQITQPLTLKQVLKTPVRKLIDSRVLTSGSQALAIIWLAEHQPEAVKKSLQQIDGAQYFSQRDMLNNMTKDYTERAQTLLSIGLALIVLVLIIRYKSLTKAVQTLLPAMLAALLILALWSFTGVAISFLHLVGFLLVVAICVDYGIFYRENRGGDIDLTYQAMAASMLTSALAFGSLITAESTSLKILASVVALGVILGFLLCPLIIKNEQRT
ncbi:MAG: MMPL family transporter [Methylococcales bacterium]|nr:MMPL family transporter [Methylococcales bacterium]